MNLVANARDAMPQGGKLTIRTSALDVSGMDPQCCGGAFPGGRVCLELSSVSRRFRNRSPSGGDSSPGRGAGSRRERALKEATGISASVGAILSSIATIGCCLPLGFAAALGAGATSAFFATLRPWLLGLAVGELR
jgi:signal transduction histidine kinase